MKENRSTINRGNRARALWRWLALALCLALLLGSVSALAEEPEAQQPAEGEQVATEPAQQEGMPEATETGTNEPQANTDPDVEVKATIKWIVDGVETTEQYDMGATPAYKGSTPTKTGAEGVRYEFVGWSPEIKTVSGDETYTAVFKTWYTITWDNYDGNNGSTTTEVEEGQIPARDVPTKDPAPEYTYSYAWEPSPAAADGPFTYTAVESENVRKYTITWQNEDGTVIETTEVPYGEIPEHAVPAKESTAEFDYVGAWDPAPVAVNADSVKTFKASYTPQRRSYTITWNNDDGTQIDTTTVEYGQMPTHADATKAADAQFTYTFAAWVSAADNESPIVAVTGPATYKATYTNTTNTYTVTWMNEGVETPLETDAAVLYDTKPEYNGAPPTRDTDGENLYTFDGWYDAADADKKLIPELPKVTGNVTYVAHYAVDSLTKPGSPFTYKLNPGKTEATIIEWDGTGINEAGALTVPDTFESGTAKVVGIGDNVFQNNPAEGATPLVSLTIPNGVKSIGKNSLYNLTALTTLTLPDSLETLGENALTGNTALATLTLRCTGTATLSPANVITHTVVNADGTTSTVSATLPASVTDIVVSANGDPTTNTANLTLGDFTVSQGHAITVETNATLTNTGALKNFGAINNSGTFNNDNILYSCVGAVTGTITGGIFYTNGQHAYANGKCTICGTELQELKIKYKGKDITKVYDATKNVTLSKNDFEIEDKYGMDLEIDKISGSYDKPDAGDRTVEVIVTLKGNDAALFGKQKVSIKAKIERKPLIITPTPSQKKTYGATDPKTYTGKVKGLLSKDGISGKLSREAGENVGKYRIIQGTIDAGANYEVQVLEEYFNIEAKNINSSDVGLVSIGNQRYTGEKVEPEITLKYGKNTLKKDTDFKVEFSENIQPGTAKVKLTGIGNYTGERESSFRILNISGGGGSGSSGGGSYGYGGFDDAEGDGEDDEEEEDPNLGKLIIKGQDHGNILFTAQGKAAPFVQFEEITQALEEGAPTPEIGVTTDENGNLLPWTLTIIPDPMTNEETGETLVLEGSERERFDELHLWLTTPLVATLTSLGCTEIVYELDSAELHIPLASLVAEIPLENAATEVVGVIEGEGAEEESDVEAVDEAVDELEVALGPTSLQVAAYDIRVEQAEVVALTERENAALADHTPVTPTYQLSVRAVIVPENGETPEITTSVNADGEKIFVLPATERLPENGWPKDMVLRVMPLEELNVEETADEPEGDSEDETEDETEEESDEPVPFTIDGIDAVFVPSVEDATAQLEVAVNPAQFVDVDGIIYSQAAPLGEGLYAVGTPAVEGEELEDLGGGSVASGLSTIGSSFSVDENGNPVFD